MAALHQDGLSAGTAKNYLAAVRHAQIALSLGDPRMSEMPQLEYVMTGLKRSATGNPRRQRLPITPAILRQMKEVWRTLPCQQDAVMLWAAATLCFFGFLRSGEVVVPSDGGYDPAVHLSFGDVKADHSTPPQFLEVTLKASKTDPFRRGVTVIIGGTGDSICPVAAVLGYMVQRGPGNGPLFKFADGRYLTRDRLVVAVRGALSTAGHDPSAYAGHSFRIGAATTAAQRGIQDSLIKTLGRWESAAYTVYIRTPRETLTSVARTLVGK